MELNILELFSGIGGMHYAFLESQVKGQVITAIDINPIANLVYSYNHKQTKVLNNNIKILKPEILDKLKINTILMSPPCQPHTRVGKKKDVADNRSDALLHICSLVHQCKHLKFILLENVKGFEQSEARNIYVEALKKGSFYFREFILSPSQLGIPNTRNRYYCLARKSPDFDFPNDRIWTEFPSTFRANIKLLYKTVESILEPKCVISNETYLNEKVLQRYVLLMDIVTATATNTMCFTKAYTYYAEGTGSVYCPLQLQRMEAIFAKLKNCLQTNNENNNEIIKSVFTSEHLELLKSLNLRYFTPREVARLMCFPELFAFPPQVTNRQKYRLLGNSVNVSIVSLLIKILCNAM